MVGAFFVSADRLVIVMSLMAMLFDEMFHLRGYFFINDRVGSAVLFGRIGGLGFSLFLAG